MTVRDVYLVAASVGLFKIVHNPTDRHLTNDDLAFTIWFSFQKLVLIIGISRKLGK